MNELKKSNMYSKRPLWQWVLLYVIIAALLYGLVYYFVIMKRGGYGSTSPAPTPATATATNSSNIYTLKTDSSNKSYLADFQGMALYTYDNDTNNTSNCTGSCATSWPPYTSGATAELSLPANITVITRSDSSKQFVWKNKPLYYFSGDTRVGQTSGDGVGGFHLAR